MESGRYRDAAMPIENVMLLPPSKHRLLNTLG